MAKWGVYGKVVGSKFLGIVEADTKKDAEAKADELLANAYVGFCHQCSSNCEDPEIDSIEVWQE